jgi:hypothetical protein
MAPQQRIKERFDKQKNCIFTNMKKILLFFILSLFTIGTASASSINITPSTQKVNIGDTFTINIDVDPAGQATAGVQFNLHFNGYIVNVNSVSEGNFLKQGGAKTIFNAGTIDNIGGTITYVYGFIITEKANVTNPGTFVSINMTAKANGFSPLDLSNVVISDPDGAAIPGSINNGSVTVGSGTLPVANCGLDKLKCENVASPVLFNGSTSYDPDGTIISYYWDFGDGTNGSGVLTTHKYTSYNWNGTAYKPFTATLKVTDNDGATGIDTQSVTIWIAGDANGDGKVNIMDASVVGLKWATSDPCADLNNDNKVNIMDASIIGLNWGKTA